MKRKGNQSDNAGWDAVLCRVVRDVCCDEVTLEQIAGANE